MSRKHIAGKIAGNTAIAGSLWEMFNGVKGVKVKVNYLMSLVMDVDTQAQMTFKLVLLKHANTPAVTIDIFQHY